MWAKTSPSRELYCLCTRGGAAGPPQAALTPSARGQYRAHEPPVGPLGNWDVPGGPDTQGAAAGRGRHLHLSVESLHTARVPVPALGRVPVLPHSGYLGRVRSASPGVSGGRWDESGGSHEEPEPVKCRASVAPCARAEGGSPARTHVPCPQVCPWLPSIIPVPDALRRGSGWGSSPSPGSWLRLPCPQAAPTFPPSAVASSQLSQGPSGALGAEECSSPA